jgi:hypothetical protein
MDCVVAPLLAMTMIMKTGAPRNDAKKPLRQKRKF